MDGGGPLHAYSMVAAKHFEKCEGPKQSGHLDPRPRVTTRAVQ